MNNNRAALYGIGCRPIPAQGDQGVSCATSIRPAQRERGVRSTPLAFNQQIGCLPLTGARTAQGCGFHDGRVPALLQCERDAVGSSQRRVDTSPRLRGSSRQRGWLAPWPSSLPTNSSNRPRSFDLSWSVTRQRSCATRLLCRTSRLKENVDMLATALTAISFALLIPALMVAACEASCKRTSRKFARRSRQSTLRVVEQAGGC